jgi:hypothetical protein
MLTKKQYNFSIIFEELNKLSEEPEVKISEEEFKEYDEIRTLREIVMEVQSTQQTYFTST